MPVPSNSALAAISDDSINQFSPLTRSSYMYSPSPSSRRRQISTPASRTRPNITRSLFPDYDLSFEAKVLGYFEELRQQQKENAALQQAILDKLDALVSVMSEPAHLVPVPSNEESQVPNMNYEPAASDPYEEVPDVSDASNRDDETLSTDCLMFLRSKSTSERNFAVQVVRHLFKPHELDGRNVRGVNGKLPLDSAKLERVRELVSRYYPVPLSCKESQWRDCRKAIDTYLRGKKYQMVHRVE